MYDIVFLSYNEAKAEENWKLLKDRFPRAQRVHGVKGIVAAHQAAAAKCNTRWFWTVDADNIVEEDFDFSFMWPAMHQEKTAVAVWRARNNVNGLVYGYGGIKLLPTRRVLQMDASVVDFTTSIGDHFHVKKELASTTVINSTPFEAWKSGFRECAKLASAVIDRQHADETEQRLDHWCTVAEGEFSDEVLRGAKEGREFGRINQGDKDALRALNDFYWLQERFAADVSSSSPAPILRGLEDMYPEKPFIRSLRQTILEYPHARWEDAMSRGQMQSKRWLVDTLYDCMFPEGHDPFYMGATAPATYPKMKKYLRKMYLCASWYGILGDMLLDKFSLNDGGNLIEQIRGLDIDPDAVRIANRLMKHWDEGWRFKSAVKDIKELTFLEDEIVMHRYDGEEVVRNDTPTIIINTSCEHIEDFDEWYARIPAGRLVVLQSNDYFDWHEHVNCSENLDTFTKSTPMRTVLFSGELELNKYTRFMRIGFR